MASRKEYEMLFQLNAQLGGSYNSTFKTAQFAIASMQKEIAALSKTQSDISAYQKQQSAVEATQKKLEVLKQQYDNIQKEIAETDTFSATLENRLLSKQQQIDRTSASLENQTKKLEDMRRALVDAGVDVSNLTGETTRLGNQIDELRKKQEEAADQANNFGAKASAAISAVSQALASAGIAKALQEIYDFFAATAEASMGFESAMTGVAKTTDLTNEELAAMSREIKLLSTDIPVTVEEFAGIGEVAGQLGIAKENLLDFSTVMAMLATATTMTAEEGATLLAQFANITRMDPSFYSNLASAIVALGNNYATTEQKITEMAQGIAASASLAGMSEADMVALAAAVTSLGIETQAGSTAMSRLISTLMTAVETGEDLEEFASIANMTAEEFTRLWGTNAVQALQAFVVGLNDTERNGKSATVALTELGITEARMQRMILSLANSGDLLNRTLETANQAWSENTALTKEAELRYATTQSQLTMMQNSYNNLKIAIGDNFTPALSGLYGVATDVLNSITEFVEKNPELVKAITAFIGVIGVATAGLTAYVAVTKVAIPLMQLFAASIPGVNIIMAVTAGVAALTGVIVGLTAASKRQRDEAAELTAVSREQYYRLQELNDEYKKAVELYGETSYEAQALRWEIEDLTAEYEAGKQKLSDYKAAHEELMQSYSEMTASHSETAGEIEKEHRSTLALIAKLEELTATTDSAAENQQAILSIIEALNEQVPELALNYEDVVNPAGKFIDSIYAIAEAQAAQAKLEAQWKEYIDRVGQHEALKSAKEAAEQNARIAQEQYESAKKAYDSAKALTYKDYRGNAYANAAREAEEAYKRAKQELEVYNEALDEATAAYEENAAKIAELEEAFRLYQKAQEEAAATGENFREVINSVKQEMNELAAAYEEAYNAALDSISGQYNLWDEAADIVATSASKINANLESQINYWQKYNENLEKLKERSADIEGLNEMIASFADGSAESVNAIAGMANASDADLRKMVTNWQKLKQEQETAAGSLAEIETEFKASMDNIQQELEATIAEMNLSEDAAKSAKQTMQGFADGAIDMLPTVQEAYKRVAQAAIAAIDSQLEIRSPSRVMEQKAEMTWAGYINKTRALEPEVTKVMAEISMAGIEAFPSLARNEAVSAQPGPSVGGNHIILTVSPSYSISGVGNTSDIATVLKEAASDLKDYILDVLEDAGIDSARRAYA